MHSASDPEELALDYLEQWLSVSQSELPNVPVESPRLDPTLRAIEHLVRQHQDLFRRHKPQEKSPPE